MQGYIEFDKSIFEVQIPLYIFSGGSLLHVGEGSISKTKEFYHGAFDFDVAHSPVLNEIAFSLYLVYGPNGERIPIGDVLFNNRADNKEFFGCFELEATSEINLAMDTARSLTNREY